MGTFTNFIGIEKTDISKSGLYIYQSGISLAEGAAIADRQAYNTGKQMIQDKINFSIELVKDELRKHLYPYFKIEDILQNTKSGKFNFDFLSGNKKNYGIKIIKEYSRLTKIFVNRIFLLTNNTGSKTIKIIDGNSTTSYTVSLVSGIIYELTLNYKAINDEITILWDSDIIVDSGLIDSENNCSCNCNKWLSIKGSDNSNKHYGIISDVNVICDVNEFLEIIAISTKFPIYYKTCAEIIDYAMLSDRINMFTLTQDLEQLKERRDYFEKKYEESFKSLLATLPNLLNGIDQFCINCKQNRYAEVI